MFKVSQAVFQAVVILRQLTQALMLYYMDDYLATLQMQLSMILTLLMILYIIKVNPFETKTQYRMMLVNEVTLYILTLIYMYFYQSFKADRYMGAIFIFVFVINFALNLLVLVVDMARTLPEKYEKAKKFYKDLKSYV